MHGAYNVKNNNYNNRGTISKHRVFLNQVPTVAVKDTSLKLKNTNLKLTY